MVASAIEEVEVVTDEYSRLLEADFNRAARQEAVDYARTSVALEGFCADPQYEKEAQRFINGEIDSDALTEFVLRLSQKAVA